MVRRKNKWKLVINHKGWKVWATKIKGGYKEINVSKIKEKDIWQISPYKYDGKKMYLYISEVAKTYKEALRIKNKFQKRFPKVLTSYKPKKGKEYIDLILERLEGK